MAESCCVRDRNRTARNRPQRLGYGPVRMASASSTHKDPACRVFLVQFRNLPWCPMGSRRLPRATDCVVAPGARIGTVPSATKEGRTQQRPRSPRAVGASPRVIPRGGARVPVETLPESLPENRMAFVLPQVGETTSGRICKSFGVTVNNLDVSLYRGWNGRRECREAKWMRGPSDAALQRGRASDCERGTRAVRADDAPHGPGASGDVRRLPALRGTDPAPRLGRTRGLGRPTRGRGLGRLDPDGRGVEAGSRQAGAGSFRQKVLEGLWLQVDGRSLGR